MKGFDFIIAVIGLFGIGEILLSVEEGLRFQGAKTVMNLRVVLDTWKILPRYYRTFVRSSIIGFWMGFKPGGATPASFMSYAFAKRFSKHPERFGKGEIEGIVAPETAAHAAGVAAMLPMITLGIPGSPTAAVMLGGLIIWGLQPGPMLFIDNPDFVWGLIASMYTGNVIGVLLVLAFVPFFAAILRIPFAILTPLIVVICAIGSYAVHNSMIDIWYMLIFGVIGYIFKKLDYPLAPLVLALVLGDMAENALAAESDYVSRIIRRSFLTGRYRVGSRRWPFSFSFCRCLHRGGVRCGGYLIASLTQLIYKWACRDSGRQGVTNEESGVATNCRSDKR